MEWFLYDKNLHHGIVNGNPLKSCTKFLMSVFLSQRIFLQRDSCRSFFISVIKQEVLLSLISSVKIRLVWTRLLLILGQKKESCFRKSAGGKFFYHLPARISRVCMRIYIFYFQKNKHTNKRIFTSKFIHTDLRFPLQTKKSAVIVDF